MAGQWGQDTAGILSAVRFATRATVRTTMQATSIELVFGRDAVLNVKKNNDQENKKRKTHNYQIGDKVLLKGSRVTKFGTKAHSGSYPIEKINNNGTIKIIMNRVTDA
eukprot:15364844-Ditylum_brightwellii.AAC.1